MYHNWRLSLGDLSDFDELPAHIKSTMARRLRDMVRDEGIRIEVQKGLVGSESFDVLITWVVEESRERSRMWHFEAGTSESVAPNRAVAEWVHENAEAKEFVEHRLVLEFQRRTQGADYERPLLAETEAREQFLYRIPAGCRAGARGKEG